MPISEKQLAANRENCLKSTGPRTPEGKAAASMNAVRHGCFARPPLLPGEDPAQFETFAAGLSGDLRPEGALETDIVTRLVATAWRLRRVPVAEAAIFSPDPLPSPNDPCPPPRWHGLPAREASPANSSAASPDSSDLSDSSDAPSSPPPTPTNPGAHYLRRLRPGADPLGGISRHEARLHRQFERDLQLLESARERRLKREREDREIALRRAQDPDDPLYDPARDPLYELRQRRLARARQRATQLPSAPFPPSPDAAADPVADPNGFVSADPAPGVRSSIQKAPDALSTPGTPQASNQNGFVSADSHHGASPPVRHSLGEGGNPIQKAPAPLPAAVPQSPAENGFVSADSPHVAAAPSPDSSDPSGPRHNAFASLDALYRDQLRIERQLGLPETNEEVQALV